MESPYHSQTPVYIVGKRGGGGGDFVHLSIL